ncbi:histidine phosphatase family protein [Nesterenkonia sphaerica]|uniref:Histidine phosphatase family protein n=1 Tax=Nesterenkonia sphaerica TaxID=1804988 RepID=A0A5R8ZZT6_9MICC|nr:histidine phosphatase family protein [Nesterenkonia sphaerica]TLP71951.1 histidine phosphatase family protein [Nesterenkonia sphaerica]
MIRIVLVRHGETEWNKAHRLQGRSDIPLAESGTLQAQITGGFVRAQTPQQGYVSSLLRTQQTFTQFGLDLQPSIRPDLAEQDLGEWEGGYAAEIRSRFPEQFEAWRAGTFTPAGGESYQQLVTRMRGAFFDMVRRTADISPSASADLSFDVRTAVAVSHGAALRVLFEGLQLIDRHQFIPLTPAAVSVIDIPLHRGPVSSSLPGGGLQDGHDLDAESALIRSLTDEQITELCRLRLINLSPELLNPASTDTVAIG